MKKSNLEKLGLELYSEELNNGLRIFIVPKDDVNGVLATFTTKFGSANNEFVPLGKKRMIKVPLGVAHFLEHKMFEQENGKDPFSFFSERGCDANANTSYYKTTYLFSGSNAFEDNINYLLDYVQNPYFTDANVEKEKGIIEQEIKMYNDDPFYKIYDGVIYNAFNIHPIKYSIAGTVKDIYNINKEDLYLCYNTFYHPSNMYLVITGNVDPIETINLIKLNQENKNYEKFQEIKLKSYDEPNIVEKEKEVVKMDIEIPKCGIGYKIDVSKIKKNIKDISIYLNMLFELKIGGISSLNEKLKDLKLITDDIEITLVYTDKHILLIIFVESNNIEKVLTMLEDELKDLSVSEDDFTRKIKVMKSSCIYRSDSIYTINTKIMNDIINYGKVIDDQYKKIDEFKYTELNKIIKNIDLNNRTIYIINKS